MTEKVEVLEEDQRSKSKNYKIEQKCYNRKEPNLEKHRKDEIEALLTEEALYLSDHLG
jgi:hypothetical protein